MKFGVAGFYKLEAVRPDGTRRVLADWFPNLILNGGLNAIGNGGQWLSECRVGSGSTAPNVNDTALESQIATTTTIHATTGTAQSSPPYYGARTNTYRFAAGDAAGNIAEVGVGLSLGGNLFSRALILDGDGNPTTITILSDEVLDVTYQLRLYPPSADVTGTVTISGTDYDYIVRAASSTDATYWGIPSEVGVQGGGGGPAAQGTVYDGTIGDETQQPTGASSGGTVTNDAYSDSSYVRGFSLSLGLDEGNFGTGISAALMYLGVGSYLGLIQIAFDPPIPKDNTQTLTLGFQHSWARKTLP